MKIDFSVIIFVAGFVVGLAIMVVGFLSHNIVGFFAGVIFLIISFLMNFKEEEVAHEL